MKLAPVLAVLALDAVAGLSAQQSARFDHARHAKVFATCTVCHAGAATPAAPLWPDSAVCGSCHDGTIQARVTWQPPATPRATNLRFEHGAHARAVAARGTGASEPLACVNCHLAEAAPWMAVQRAAIPRCLECHGVKTAHLAAPDTACATCHVPLAEATGLAAAAVAKFDAPPSHQDTAFVHGAAHGAAARAGTPIAASCATCHARDFCLQCHVDAPEQPAIAALPRDPRATAIRARLSAPGSHGDGTFLATHGAAAREAPTTCASCHTRESCLTCHAATVRVAAAMPAAGPDRGIGAVIVRRPPPSHGADFARRHKVSAAVAAASCASCHTRADCLECHRPGAGRAAGYHPVGFLARHPAAAYARETSCSDCHNTAGFCTSCHARSGVVARGQLRPGYHDVSPAFIAGHGAAARQNLESCTSCHVERDCLTCHSVIGGRRFDPHGPGFDPNRLIKKNPEMCTACHGRNIPTR